MTHHLLLYPWEAGNIFLLSFFTSRQRHCICPLECCHSLSMSRVDYKLVNLSIDTKSPWHETAWKVHSSLVVFSFFTPHFSHLIHPVSVTNHMRRRIGEETQFYLPSIIIRQTTSWLVSHQLTIFQSVWKRESCKWHTHVHSYTYTQWKKRTHEHRDGCWIRLMPPSICHPYEFFCFSCTFHSLFLSKSYLNSKGASVH